MGSTAPGAGETMVAMPETGMPVRCRPLPRIVGEFGSVQLQRRLRGSKETKTTKSQN